ncbi:MAG: hypothetical protein AB7H97_02100 [Pseudobdellovibrionaceae bacterium]
MPLTTERDDRGPDRNPENRLTAQHLAKLATYMSGGTVLIDGRTFEFVPRRETVEDDLKVDFEIVKNAQGSDLTMRVKQSNTERDYNLNELGIDLIDRTDPIETWIYGEHPSGTTLTFKGLKENHRYEIVFHGEEGGVAAKLPPRPVELEGEERKEA